MSCIKKEWKAWDTESNCALNCWSLSVVSRRSKSTNLPAKTV